MNNQAPLTSATDSDLAHAVEGNLFALFRSMAVLQGYEIFEGAGLSHHYTWPTNPMFKGVWRARLAPDEADAAIEKTVDWFKAREAPYVFWWTGADDQPADLPVRLIEHGFALNILGDPGMGADLHTLDETDRTPSGFHVEQVYDQSGLEDWRDAFITAYDIPPFTGQAWVDATLAAGGADAPWKPYVGYLDDKPVACNILYTGAGVAGVYGVGTVPEARRMGIGAAITLRPLLDARAQGYRYGVLFSTGLGHRMYLKLGFHNVPNKIGRYILWNT